MAGTPGAATALYTQKPTMIFDASNRASDCNDIVRKNMEEPKKPVTRRKIDKALKTSSSGLIIRQKEPNNLETPFDQVDSFLTPTELFYIRSHFPTPKLDLASYQLRIDGAVRNPFSLSYKQLAASPSASPDPARAKAEYALLQTEWKAKQSALAAEKQRIEYEIANSTGANRKEWEHKLALWRQEKTQAEQDQASAKARLLSSH
jgi:hypothetical protein